MIHDASAVILAAGQGTRMRTHLPKSMVPVAGRPIIGHLLSAVRQAGVSDVVVVVGHKAETLRTYLGPEVSTPLQSVRLGTAHAVETAKDSVGAAQDVFVLVGDSPLIRSTSIARLYETHRQSGAACSFLTAQFDISLPYARVLRGEDGSVREVIEERDCTPEQKKVREYLTSHFVFSADALWPLLDGVVPHPVTQERYLTDVLGSLLAAGERVEAVVIDDWRELVGLNTPEEVAWAEEAMAHG